MISKLIARLSNAVAGTDAGSPITGTDVGGSKRALDTYIRGGTIATATGALQSLNEPTKIAVPYSAISVDLLVSNESRSGFSFHNRTDKIAYISPAASTSATSFSIRLVPNAYYERMNGLVYTGLWTVIWEAAGTGDMQVTEYT